MSVYARSRVIFPETSPIVASRRILVCPDALKETADARAAAAAIALGVRDAVEDAVVTCIPLADGGEGTLDVLASAITDLVVESANVPGPRADRGSVEASFGVTASRRRAVIELATCAGLARLPSDDRDPERTGTAGVGHLLELARRRLEPTEGMSESREVFVALGGSATVDGGIGALRAMGVHIVGPEGPSSRPLVGADLAAVQDLVVPESWRATWDGIRVRVLADVRNPLTGPTGAARIFGPQKGASPEAVERLEDGLARWGGLLAERFGVDPSMPGSGAAGGVGLALAAVVGARIEPGLDAVASLIGLDAAIDACDLIITSEGRLDRQSVMGKVIGGVLERADRRGVPVIAVPGSIDAALPDEIRRRFAAIRTLEETVGIEAARGRPLDALRLATRMALGSLRG